MNDFNEKDREAHEDRTALRQARAALHACNAIVETCANERHTFLPRGSYQPGHEPVGPSPGLCEPCGRLLRALLKKELT
jgi:hypothetical protein